VQSGRVQRGVPLVAEDLVELDQHIFHRHGKNYTKICGTTLALDGVEHNNLGGQGPDLGPEGIVWYGREILGNGKVKRKIHVEAHAESEYKPLKHPDPHNGVRGEFGQVVVPSGHDVKIRFRFKDSYTGRTLTMHKAAISFYDLDQGRHNNSREFVHVFGKHEVKMVSKSKRDFELDHVDGHLAFMANHFGTASGNPHTPEHLTHKQKDRAVIFRFTDVDHILVQFGSTKGPAFRKFNFAFMDSMGCHLREVQHESDSSSYWALVGGIVACLLLGIVEAAWATWSMTAREVK